METPPHNRASNSLDVLLLHLNPDRELAAHAYEKLRSELIAFFARHGCVQTDELADETLNRAALQLAKGTILKSHPNTYVRGIGRHVMYRHFRERSRSFDPPPVRDLEEIERETECLRKCGQIHSEIFQFVKNYTVSDERARLRIADGLGISIDGLRSKVHRFREELRRCRRKCIEKFEASKII